MEYAGVQETAGLGVIIMEKTPKVARVKPEADWHLRVLFDNGIEKRYDCQQLMNRPAFDALRDESLFRLVQVDPGGYGVSWNADIDLSEYELWMRGVGL